MSQSIDTSALNSQFLSLLDTPDGMNKVAAASGRYIRDRLREECVVDKIIPPEPVNAKVSATENDKASDVASVLENVNVVFTFEPIVFY